MQNVKVLLFTLPTDAALQLQHLTKINTLCCAANVYSILPDSGWKRASVWVMLIHNISAFTLHTNPLLYMWERLIRTHHHPWYIRLPSRIPVCKPLLLLPSPILNVRIWLVPLPELECIWHCLYWQPHKMHMH